MNPLTDQRIKRFHISLYDFEGATAFFDAAQNYAPDTLEYEALVLSGIIHYARPFSHNEKHGKNQQSTTASRLDDVDILTVLGPDAALHDQVITFRNKAVAHAESTHYPVEIMPPATIHRGGRVLVSQRWHPMKTNISLQDLLRIAEKLRTHCMERICASVAYKSPVSPLPP